MRQAIRYGNVIVLSSKKFMVSLVVALLCCLLDIIVTYSIRSFWTSQQPLYTQWREVEGSKEIHKLVYVSSCLPRSIDSFSQLLKLFTQDGRSEAFSKFRYNFENFPSIYKIHIVVFQMVRFQQHHPRHLYHHHHHSQHYFIA